MESSIIQKAQIRYTGRVGSYIVENAKISYGWRFNLFEMLQKVWLGSNIIVENAKIRYG